MTDPGQVQYLDAKDSLHLKKDGLYERFETTFVKRQLRAGQTFVDAGAHIGYYSALAASIVGPGGLVLAFEPDPTNMGLLRRNTERFGEVVQPREMALADKAGRATLYLSPENTGDNRLFRTAGWRDLEVDVTTIDERPELDGRAVDFLKMDIQGLELKALQGAKEAIARSPRLVGIIEYWPLGLKLNGMKQPGEFLDALRSLGLRAYVKGTKRRIEPAKPPDLKRVGSHANLLISREPLL
jgi:FkbM family methyltransferase